MCATVVYVFDVYVRNLVMKRITSLKMRQVLSPVIQVLVWSGPTQPKGKHEHMVSGPPVEWGKMTGAPLA